MKKRVIVGLATMTVAVSLGISSAFAAPGAFLGNRMPIGDFGSAITDEDKANMEARLAEREEKLNAFIGTLSETQKAAFDELFGTERQRITGDGKFRMERQGLTDEEKAEMEGMRTHRQEKLNVFIESLTDEQKALYEAMTPARTEAGEKPDMESITANREAFINSLTDEQKAAYEELFGGFRNSFKREKQPEAES